MAKKGSRIYTRDFIHSIALKYKHKIDFRTDDAIYYEYAKRHGWVEYVCSHMVKKLKYTKEFVHSIALKYEYRAEFAQGDKKYYIFARSHGWLEYVCSHMPKVKNQYSKNFIKDIALKYKYLTDFYNYDRKYYNYAHHHLWLDEVCSHMVAKVRLKYSKELIQQTALEYDFLSQFRAEYERYYRYALKNGWATEVFSHMLRAPTGRTKSQFIDDCERNNNGLGILYLIKCTGNSESFYKIGITSRSVHKRCVELSSIGYVYCVGWQITGNPEEIWDIEHELHRKTKQYRYQPDLWGGAARETFKCHGNCKILREPSI